ncbi:hypothetical protein [Pseudomonas sp. URMO17WK12:I8]
MRSPRNLHRTCGSPEPGYPQVLSAREKLTQQLRFIFVGARYWQGLGNPG